MRARETKTSVVLPPRQAPLEGEIAVLDACRLPASGASLAVLEMAGTLVAAPVVAAGNALRRVRPGEGASAEILSFVTRDSVEGRFRFARLSTGFEPSAYDERSIDVDQSHESVVVGERAVVKLMARVAPGPQPALDLARHLAEVGFAEVPTPLGAVTWDAPRGGETLLATAAAYLPGATDGWDWLLALVRADIEAGGWSTSREAANGLGALTARLHAALATPSSVLPVPVADWSPDACAAWRRQALTTAEEAGSVGGEEGARVAARLPRIRAALEGLAWVETPAIRIHGDLHVGQFLRHDNGDAVSDFDGNPLAPGEERLAMKPAVKDVASLLRSLDHVGRICQRDGAPPAVVQSLVTDLRTACLGSYRAELGRLGHPALLDERLLHPFELEQACHEVVYAARYHPQWLTVADLALTALLP